MPQLKLCITILLLFFLRSEDSFARIFERFEYENQYIEIHITDDPKVINIEGDNGRFFSRKKQTSIEITAQPDMSAYLEELKSFLIKNKFDDSFYKKIQPMFENIQVLGADECRALFINLSAPLSSQGFDLLIEQIDKVKYFLEAPEKASRSFDVEELEIREQRVSLRLYVDDDGNAVSIGLISKNKDFLGYRFQGDLENGYSLFDPDGEWLLSVEVKNDDVIELRTHKPVEKNKEHLLVINSQTNLTKLSLQAGEWSIDDGLIGADQNAYLQEWKSLERTLPRTVLDQATQSALEENFSSCRVYEDQLRAKASTASFCEDYLNLEIQIFEEVVKLKQREQDYLSLKKEMTRCLATKGLITPVHGYYRHASADSQNFQQTVKDCIKSQSQPFEQDFQIISLTQTRLGKRILNTDNKRKDFAQSLHAKAFAFCIQEGLDLDHEECQGLIKKTANEFFMEKTLLSLIGNSSTTVQGQEIIDQYRSCHGSSIDCARAIFKEVARGKISDLSAFDETFPREIRIDPDNYPKLKDHFDQSYLYCSDDSLKKIKSFESVLLSYHEVHRRCVEKSYLDTFHLAYGDYLKNTLLANVWGLAPEYFSAFRQKKMENLRDKINRGEILSLTQLSEQFPALNKNLFSQALAGFLPYLQNRDHLGKKWEESLLASLAAPKDKTLSAALLEIFKPLSLQEVQAQTNEIIKQAFKLRQTQLINTKVTNTVTSLPKSEFIRQNLTKDYEDCVNQFSTSKIYPQIDQHLYACSQYMEANLLYIAAKDKLERDVSFEFELTGAIALKVLAPLQDLSRCIDIQVHEDSVHSDSLDRVNACIKLAYFDVGLNLVQEKIKKNKALFVGNLGEKAHQETNDCFIDILSKLSEQSTKIGSAFESKKSFVHRPDRTRSVLDITHERLMNNRSLLSYLEVPKGKGSSVFTQSDASKISSVIYDLAKYKKELDINWPESQIAVCHKKADELILNALRESFVYSSPEFHKNSRNRSGESDEEVLRGLLDNEILQLILDMRDNQNELRLRSVSDPREISMTKEFTVDSLARSVDIISLYLARGFVFDRDLLKTELVIFRTELKEALRWMNSQNEAVPLKELADFFRTSQLADLLAMAEISSQVQSRFLGFINQMEINEIAQFNARAGYRPDHLLSKGQKEEKQRLLLKFNDLRKLTREMTSSYDFRRILLQDSQKGKEVLELIKLAVILPQIAGNQVSPVARTQVWQKIGDLILDDNTPGGFADRFVAEVAQGYLDQEKNSKWAITRWLFFSDGDFDWDELRSTVAGRKALGYYSRYLLLPKIMNASTSPYLRNLREKEFKRYLRLAQAEQ